MTHYEKHGCPKCGKAASRRNVVTVEGKPYVRYYHTTCCVIALEIPPELKKK